VGIAGGKDLQIHAPQGLDVTGGCRGCHAAGGCDGRGCPCTTQEAAAGNLVLGHSRLPLFSSFCLFFTNRTPLTTV